jgi:hypothetical protein
MEQTLYKMAKIHDISLHLIINILKQKTGFAIQDPTANAKLSMQNPG